MSDNKKMNRRSFMKMMGIAGAGAAAAATGVESANAAAGRIAREGIPNVNMLQGTKLQLMLNDFPFQTYIISKMPEFTEQTGIELEYDLLAWPVLLEQSEIELASGGSNYDVMIQIFIKAQRWMRAGWSYPLDEFIADSDYDLEDFIPSTRNAMLWEGVQYGIPFLAESTQMIYRQDKLEEAGLEVPQTFDELDAVLEAIHDAPDFYAYVGRTEPNGVHFPWPIWLQGFGGDIFKDAPNNLTPMLNSPEALEATTRFVNTIDKYSIAGSQIYATPDCQNAMAQGNAGFWVDALGIFPPIRNEETSTVADDVAITLVPGGPAGRFPQIASHGYQIPKNANDPAASWEFIQWATSAETMLGAALEGGYFALPRESVLTSEEYNEKWSTEAAPIGELIAEAVALSDVRYRVVPEFPEVGQRVGQGIGEIISGQKSVEDAMNDVQSDVEQIMINNGHDIDM